ncbi:nitrogen regulation protein NR [Vibrio anguillarum]|uniref:DUF4124 domain-containing protein n=1 Tax=Vibrio anguillarum TaxID=55601 RepID=UPI000B53D0BB|nr:DUF4124 domain-containing protein [Vibrio anguillarum]ASG06254.1 nitrogen regulation protein NR [Vibrio anguillarum]
MKTSLYRGMTVNLIRTLLLTLIMLYSATSIAQNVYTWVDANGVLHLSDVPQDKGAKQISIPDFQADAPEPTFETSHPVANLTKNLPQEKSATHVNKIEPLTIAIRSPADDETLRSNAGVISINAELNRNLTVSEQLQLVMNDKAYGAPATQPTWTLKNLDRGTHRFLIQVVVNGKIIASSNSVTVHLHRASIK